MNYALGHAVKGADLFMNFPTKKSKISKEACERLVGNRHKELAAYKIWRACLNMVLDDIIDNRVIFKLPTQGKESEMYVKGISDQEFVEARQNGKWQDVDYLMSNFTGYQPILTFQRAGYIVKKPLFVDKRHRDRLTENVNQGKGYY